ncbi:hypothetical protein ELI02_02075 [Rhizobium leguminosarum]|nr:hypothetical protein ELI02_02075 [Rhizobium leguminosarum]
MESASIKAGEIHNVTAFGTVDLLETVEKKRDKKNEILRAKHEVTAEYGIAGMVQGFKWRAVAELTRRNGLQYRPYEFRTRHHRSDARHPL